jgi:hypothetical protein
LSSFQQTIERFAQAELQTTGSVDIKRVTADCIAKVRANPVLREMYLDERLGADITRIVERALMRARPTPPPVPPPRPGIAPTPARRDALTRSEAPIRTGSQVQTRDELRRQIQEEASTKTVWIPSAPSKLRPADLLDMNRADVMGLAKQHAAIAINEAVTARWLHRIATLMDDYDVVGTRFSVDGLNEMLREADIDQRGISTGGKALTH